MLIVVIAAAIWGIGMFLGTPKTMRWIMIGILYLAVIAMHLVLPDGHVWRLATGTSAAPWLIFGGMAVLVVIYRSGLVWLRNKAIGAKDTQMTAPNPDKFTDTEINRYARHIMLRELGGPGQKALKNARVLVIGAGGLGSPALLYLAASGVGTIGIIDDDIVENSNLQRQVIHMDADIGAPKVHSAAAKMRAQNPFITVRPYARRLDAEIAPDLFAEYDMILDGTDNFDTRYLVNRVAIALGKPLISGALSQWEGQISVFDPAHEAPCYQCIFPQAPAAGLAPSCAEAGVVGPLPGVVGAMMALEAVKLITGAGDTLRGRMMIYDALFGETRTIGLKRRSDCPICGTVGEV